MLVNFQSYYVMSLLKFSECRTAAANFIIGHSAFAALTKQHYHDSKPTFLARRCRLIKTSRLQACEHIISLERVTAGAGYSDLCSSHDGLGWADGC